MPSYNHTIRYIKYRTYWIESFWFRDPGRHVTFNLSNQKFQQAPHSQLQDWHLQVQENGSVKTYLRVTKG